MSPTGAEARARLQQISFIVVQLGKEWYPHFHIDKGGGGGGGGGGEDASKAACVLHSIVETNAGAEGRTGRQHEANGVSSRSEKNAHSRSDEAPSGQARKI